MIDHIDHPAAIVRVWWLTPDKGGRVSGPPTAPVYAANCSFPLGGEAQTVPGWPATAEKFSLLIQRMEPIDEGAWVCKVDFLDRDGVKDHLRAGGRMLVMEGPKVVGHATITEVLLNGEEDT